MNIIWDNQTEKIFLCNFPGFKVFAKEIEEFFIANFKHPIVQGVFELSKSLPAEKIEGIVGIEAILPLPMPDIPKLLSYDFEFLLCLEYLFVTDKTWQACEKMATLFHMIHKETPYSEMGYNGLAEFLSTCFKKKRDLKTTLI